MSTRRSTRATSRQASSRGASPAISAADIPATPRRASRRAGNAPLPAVGLRTSTAYGTNTVPEPARAAGPQISEQLNSVLGGILNPVPEANTPGRADSQTPAGRGGRQSHGSTPAPSSANRSFHHESGIFSQAAIDDSVVQESPELHDIPEERESVASGPFPPSFDARLEREGITVRQELEALARRRLVQVRAASGQTTLSDIIITREASRAWAWSLIKFIIACAKEFWLLITIILLTLGTIKALSSSDIRFYGLDITHNIGQFIPYSIAHPLDNFNPAELKDIHRRLNDLEYQVAKAKTHPDFDPKSITKLEKMLPDFLVVKKDRYGNRVIPDDFWHALQDKIRSDQTLLSDQPETTGRKASPGTALSVKDVERIAGKEWDKFIKSNRAKLGTVESELAKIFPQLMEDNHVASKAEIIEMIRQNWDENRKEVNLEISQLTKKLENASRQIQKLHHNPAGPTVKEVKAIAEDVVRKLLPHAQLEALARSNLQQTVNYGLSRVNHFSKGTGAVIDPHLTSPNYIFPSQDVWFPDRWMRAVIGNAIPAPRPPETALTKWDEHGDCWCSPSKDSDGFGPSLGVLMASKIYPDQVVVEHISPSAAIEPGAAPREMELLAYIEDMDLYNSFKAMSDDIFGAEPDSEIQDAYGFVRIASFTYDIEWNQNVQAFPVQLDMKALGASTNKIIVRSKSNWGGQNVGYTCIYRVRLHGEIA